MGSQLQERALKFASFAAYIISCLASRGRWRSTVGGSRFFLICRGWWPCCSGKLTFFLRGLLQNGFFSSACGVQLSLAFAPATLLGALDLVCGGTPWSPLTVLVRSNSDHCSPHLTLVLTPQRECPVGWTI